MLRKFWNDESGQGMTEYILIIALVAVIVIVAVKLFGKQIKALFESSTETIKNETSPQ